ncbi:MAG: tRNA (adenosine(37)-N6)-dimethylallyltransferase MiaA [Gammaproteobacteria bacterium]
MNPAILLKGPTASGKTALAVHLVERLPVDIISVDSGQVYRGMDIGTAKPPPEVLARAPHRLIDILDPAEAYSAGRFRRDALAAMREIHAAGRIPLLVGGTMLYFRVLEAGLAELPPADPGLRAELESRAARVGWPALHAELARADPPAAARIHPHDAQRIQRALEVFLVTGRPISDIGRRSTGAGDSVRFIKIVLAPVSRELLRERIARRFLEMIDRGFIEEVAGLHARPDLHRDLPSMRAVGYRQLWDLHDGRCAREEAIRRGIAATQRLAKRQMTWLRGEPGGVRHDALEPAVNTHILRRVRRELDNDAPR